jgi:3-hydroxybutyryl-CoA dehydrogenase
MEIKTFGVVGAGQMGSGIAQVAAMSGLQVIMNDIKDD